MPTLNVLIIGAGRIGQTLAALIDSGSAGATIHLWDKRPELVPNQQPLLELVAQATVIFCCTPSWAVRDVLMEIRPKLNNAVVVTLAKGCEASTGRTMAEVLIELLSSQPHGVLGGPMMSEVLNHGHRGIGVFASASDQAAAIVMTLFNGTILEITRSDDDAGVSLCGCIKNIYAFIVGMSVGLNWDDERRRQAFEAASQEFLVCGQALGISSTTLNGPAGIDDFTETATSPSSHNRSVGEELGKNGYLSRSCEATVTLPSIIKRLPQAANVPLLSLLPAIIAGQQRPDQLQHVLHSLTASRI